MASSRPISMGFFLNRISALSFFNSPKPNCEMNIDVQPNKNFLILTGYNGSGKSRILSMIHESLSLVRDHNYPGIGTDWAAEIYLEGGFRVRCIKLKTDQVTPDTIKSKVSNLVKNEKEIRSLFERSSKAFIKKDGSSTTKSESEKDLVHGFACSALQKESDSKVELSPASIESVFYTDDKLHFNFKKKLVEAVFDDEPGINQTLFILLHEFVAKIARSNGTEKKVKELFAQFILQHNDYNLEDVKKFISENLAEPNFPDEANPIESTEAFIELNNFFAMTNRKLVWRDETTFMELNSSLVHWSDFSKGEKTLLTIFLITYLYQDSATFIFDEPDLSLHMEWQKMLLPALLRVAPKAQFIISTHSPFMVMNTDSEQIVNLAKLYSEAV